MNKIKLTIVSCAALLGILTMTPAYVGAAPADQIKGGVNAVGGNEVDVNGNPVTLSQRITTIVNIMLYILGAIAVIMIVIGGIRYTTSNGDSAGISGAKNTILYAIVGLVVAILAYAIVNFVLGAFQA
jgi:hypothetical protein